MNALTSILRDLVFPRFCAACDRSLADEDTIHVCRSCEAEIEWITGPRCDACGAPSRVEPVAIPCPDCIGKPIRFRGAVALGVYEGRLKKMILRFKRASSSYLGAYFGRLLAERLRRRYDLVAGVPMFALKHLRAGYDHAQVLGECVATELRLPFREDTLVKVRWTPPQKALRLEQRLKNPVGAFRARAQMQGARILLLDDVLTTGATLSACADALRAAGVREVAVAVIARG